MGRLTLLVVLLIAAPVAAEATLLRNGRFTDVSGGMPSGWRPEAWNKDYSEFGWEAGADGVGMARIVNRTANDARYCQPIAVTPGGSYRVTARVKTENVGTTTAGALLAIEPRVADSVDLKGTQDWQLLQVTAANEEATTWDICLRLGSYANLNTGTAWFSDVQVVQFGGPAPGAAASRRPRLPTVPSLATIRQTPWMQLAAPLVGGLLLALGLGIVGRRR
jgi:hypothetical protein